MSNNVHSSPRPRKLKEAETMKQEIMAQVHKQIKSAASSDNDHANSEDNVDVPKSDRNENYNVIHTPSREISVDGETQINTKILSLIETEMKRDINKHSHFTESRPQSLSFYEDEKIPEELSGNLELLSPEEKKHYRKRKDHSQIDTDERNAYNAIQDLYNPNKEPDELLGGSNKKTKSRKKRYVESETGIGDSREMMIPKEKRKSKRKKRDGSPSTTTNTTKRKHKNRTRDEDHQVKNDITLALEELQDDVFENALEDFSNKTEKMKKSPRRTDKIYVQKKSRFEETTKQNSVPLSRQTAQDLDEISNFEKRFSSPQYPVEIAISYQKWWLRFSTLCHGLLGGLALGHWLYIICNFQNQDQAFLIHYAYYSDIYVGLFFALCVLCLLSVFDRMDIGHLSSNEMSEFFKHKKCSFVVLAYVACLIVHLSTATYDEKLSLLAYRNHTILTTGNQSTMSDGNYTFSENQITFSELKTWNHLSLWRAILAFTAWIVIGLGPPEDMLYSHLANMEQYLPDK